MTTARRAAEVVAPIFKKHEWVWRVRDGQQVDPYIPSVRDLQAMFQRLQGIARTDDRGLVTSGRLAVEIGEMGETAYLLHLGEQESDE